MRRDIPPALRQHLADARHRSVPAGQIIQYEGDVAREVYFVRSGVVKMYDIDELGNEKVLHLLEAPGVVPLAFFSGEGVPTRWYYTTLTDCEVHVLDRRALERLMYRDAAVGRYLVRHFSAEVHEILLRLDSLGKSDIPAKLHAVLTYLAVRHGVPAGRQRRQWRRIPFPVNHQLLADMIGVTRESAALSIKSLADSGAVRYPRTAQLEINTVQLARQ